MTTYFRVQSRGEAPERLLDPENQFSQPWGGAEPGRTCDKCGGSGETEHACESCRVKADPQCEVCSGEVRFVGRCPACRGTGTILDERREGVSVFPDQDALYRYMLRRDGNLEGRLVVELEGEPTDDEDWDADEGALLVRPTRVVAVHEVDLERAGRLAGEREPA